MKNISDVSASIEFLSIGEAAFYLPLKQFTQRMIDYKLADDTTVFDVNSSINELVMIDKTIDKKVIINDIIDYINAMPSETFESSRKFWRDVSYDNSNIPYFIHAAISFYHVEKENVCSFSKYAIFIMKDNHKFKDGFYFLYEKDVVNIMGDFESEYEKIINYSCENPLFYLALDEFIKEFSPTKYYEKTKRYFEERLRFQHSC